MTSIAASAHLHSQSPRSPSNHSTDLSQRVSLKQRPQENSPGSPTKSSPRTRLARKRAVSLNSDSVEELRIGDIAFGSAKSVDTAVHTDSLREQVCLCQPDPKIPRPRNAFILYRQHYQAQVVARHPGLANPEISKIIGEQWKNQPPEVKSDWKKLAEEEKQRHQRQYPGYRYQPRRGGKPNSFRPVSLSLPDRPARCPKCSGKYISTPSTPLTPFTPALELQERNDRALPLFQPYRVTESEQHYHTRDMYNAGADTPRTAHLPKGSLRSQYPYTRHVQALHEGDEDMDLLTPSPGQKRRRVDDDRQKGHATNFAVPFTTATEPGMRNIMHMSLEGARPQLPNLEVLGRPQRNMGSPMQQSPIQAHTGSQNIFRSRTFDESLRLPPLQTETRSSAHIGYTSLESRIAHRETQAKSVEAMVMTIPYINKIKVLSKISPPLCPPGPFSPALEIRGSVIAVEGPDKELSAAIGAFINKSLHNDCAVKTWNTSVPSSQQNYSPPTDVSRAGAVSATSATKRSLPVDKEAMNPFVQYLQIIQHWHKNSQDITRYISTKTTRSSSPSEPNLSKSFLSNKNSLLPVALIHTGFSLTLSDSFALRIPINDSYAPVDHWQWMATLWRGIVGPDLTIYGTSVGKEEMAKYGGVEVRTDCAAIVVRVLPGETMDEKSLRRLGFEVLEFVRNIEGGVYGRG